MYTIGLDLAVQAARHPRLCSMSRGASSLQYSRSIRGQESEINS